MGGHIEIVTGGFSGSTAAKGTARTSVAQSVPCGPVLSGVTLSSPASSTAQASRSQKQQVVGRSGGRRNLVHGGAAPAVQVQLVMALHVSAGVGEHGVILSRARVSGVMQERPGWRGHPCAEETEWVCPAGG